MPEKPMKPQETDERIRDGLIEALREDRNALVTDLVGVLRRDRDAGRKESRRQLGEVLGQLESARSTTAPSEAQLTDDDLQRAQLALTYSAWRTMLGREGAASVFLAERVNHRGRRATGGGHVRILNAPFARAKRGWTLAVTVEGKPEPLEVEVPSELPVKGKQPGEHPLVVGIDGLEPDMAIVRLEIRDQTRQPLYLGLGPAVSQAPAPESHEIKLSPTAAASPFLAERVSDTGERKSGGGHIRVLHAPFDETGEDWTLVAVIEGDSEPLEADLPPNRPVTSKDPLIVGMEGLKPEKKVISLEIRDQTRTPVHVGLGPAIGSYAALEEDGD
jgi:hypothetical protein